MNRTDFVLVHLTEQDSVEGPIISEYNSVSHKSHFMATEEME